MECVSCDVRAGRIAELYPCKVSILAGRPPIGDTAFPGSTVLKFVEVDLLESTVDRVLRILLVTATELCMVDPAVDLHVQSPNQQA